MISCFSHILHKFKLLKTKKQKLIKFYSTDEFSRIDQCRDTMIDMIKIFTESQKKKLKSRIELNMLKVKDITGVIKEIKEVIA